jgi:hypothetical protein
MLLSNIGKVAKKIKQNITHEAGKIVTHDVGVTLFQEGFNSEIVYGSLWEKNESTSCCRNCDFEFQTFHRKHHCRSCGGIFCESCCHSYEPTKFIESIIPTEVSSIESTIRLCES